MAKSIADLFLTLRGDSSGLDRDLDKAMGKTRARLNKFARTTAVGATAAIGAGLAASYAIFKEQGAEIDKLAKTADKLGEPIEQLQALQHTGELTGVATNKMSVSIQRMNRRLAEAARGTGEARGALEELGLSAEELIDMPLVERMAAISDAFHEVEKPADRVRLAFKLWDSEGVGLVNTMMAGSDAIRGAVGELEDLGATITRVDAAKVEAANDALHRLDVAAATASNTLAVELAPVIEVIANRMTDFVKDSNDVADKLTLVTDIAAMAFGLVGNVVQGYIFLAHTLYGALKMNEAAVTGIAVAYVDAFEKISGVDTALDDKLEKRIEEAEAAGEKAMDAVNAIADGGLFSDQVAEGLSNLRAEANNAAMGVGEARKAIEEFEPTPGLINLQGEVKRLSDLTAELGETKEAERLVTVLNNLATGVSRVNPKNLEKAEVALSAFWDSADRGVDGSVMIDRQESLRRVADEAAGIDPAPVDALAASVDNLATETAAAADQMERLRSKADDVFERTRIPIEKLNAEMRELGMMYSRGLIDQTTYTRAVADAEQRYSEASEALARMSGGYETVSETANAAADSLTRLQMEGERVFERTRTPLERYNAELARLKELHDAGAISADTHGRAVDQATTRYMDSTETMTAANETLRKSWDITTDEMGRSLDRFIDTGKFRFDDFMADLGRSFLKSGIRDLFSNLFASDSSTGFFGSLGGVFGGARADGGPVESGKSYLVGEEGPELFTPGSSGMITPNGAGGLTVHVHQTNNFESGQDAVALQRMLPMMDRTARRAVRDEIMRSDGYRRSFGG